MTSWERHLKRDVFLLQFLLLLQCRESHRHVAVGCVLDHVVVVVIFYWGVIFPFIASIISHLFNYAHIFTVLSSSSCAATVSKCLWYDNHGFPIHSREVDQMVQFTGFTHARATHVRHLYVKQRHFAVFGKCGPLFIYVWQISQGGEVQSLLLSFTGGSSIFVTTSDEHISMKDVITAQLSHRHIIRHPRKIIFHETCAIKTGLMNAEQVVSALKDGTFWFSVSACFVIELIPQQ